MRPFLNITLIVALLLGFSSCEKPLQVYDYPVDGLNFVRNRTADTIRNFSFVYGEESVMEDTVWVEITTSGFLSDKDRAFEFKQINVAENNAVAGKHFVSLDDPRVSKFHFIPANANGALVPIIFLRDASLQDGDYSLLLSFGVNDNFSPAFETRAKLRYIISDRLTKPTNWATYMNHFFGQWGAVKHQFMIDISGEKWDDEYLEKEIGVTAASPGRNDAYDAGYCQFLADFFADKLAERNAERAAETPPLGPLSEADGTIVSF